MAIPVLVSHASPATAMPRRGRRERHGFETIRTPIAIPEVPLGEFRPMDPLPMGQVALYGLHRFEGATWSRLAERDVAEPFPVEAVLTFLGDPAALDRELFTRIAKALEFSPVSPSLSQCNGLHAALPYRQAPWGLAEDAANRIVGEERERTRSHLRSWIADNLAIAGDVVMVRKPVFLEIFAWHGRINVYARNLLGLSGDSVAGIRPDRARELALSHGCRFDDEGMEESLGLFEDWISGLSTDDDVLRIGHALPGLVFAIAERKSPFRLRRDVKPDAEGVQAALDGIRRWRLRGALGALSGREVGDSIEASLDALDRLVAAKVQVPIAMRGPKGVGEAIRRWYLSRSADLAPEDAAALSLAG